MDLHIYLPQITHVISQAGGGGTQASTECAPTQREWAHEQGLAGGWVMLL